MKKLDALQTAALLKEKDQILILCHRRPDGDTLGAGFGLLRALRDLGKQVRIECADEFPSRFQFLWEGLDMDNQPQFEPDFVVAVDVASTGLLGAGVEEKWKDKVDLSIDHHSSNSGFAKAIFLDPEAAAACQIMHKVIAGLVPTDPANCLMPLYGTGYGYRLFPLFQYHCRYLIYGGGTGENRHQQCRSQ